MKKLMSLVLALAVAGVIGVTAGCKKKEEAPAPVTPKTEQPVQPAAPAENQTANQTDNQTAAAPAEKPAEKK
uniref:Lipoprotein n=1 Tax=Caldimicrobium thiodismutans TaxID=1653476 RepID=A0A832GRQ0_9BACT